MEKRKVNEWLWRTAVAKLGGYIPSNVQVLISWHP
jgi:hypothetical protein